jgi:hypothetical protein
MKIQNLRHENMILEYIKKNHKPAPHLSPDHQTLSLWFLQSFTRNYAIRHMDTIILT